MEEEELTQLPVWEVMTEFNERSAMGRVVVNPPERMAPLKPHPTGEAWYFCEVCGFACLSSEKMLAHKEKHNEKDEKMDEGDEYAEPKSCQSNGFRQDSDDNDAVVKIKYGKRNKKNHFQCGVCGKILSNAKTFRNHRIVHQKDRPRYKCDICGALFKQKGALPKHAAKCHNPNFKHVCKFCPCRYETKLGLKQHVHFCPATAKIHSSGLDSTETRDDDDDYINDHDEIRPKAKPAITRIEGKHTQKKEAVLKPHVTATRKYQNASTKIKLPFTGKYSLVARTDRSVVLKALHQNAIAKATAASTDIGASSRCDICEKQFASVKSLRAHLQLHLGGSFRCKKCQATFRRNYALQQHNEDAHGNGTYKCMYCPCKLKTAKSRGRHYFIYHKKNSNNSTSDNELSSYGENSTANV